MTNTTAVPSVTWTERGFVAPSAEAVLAGVQADWSAAFGRNLNYQLTTPQGQLVSSEAAVIFDANALFVYYTNQVDPAFATGRMQDAIGRISYIYRDPAEPTVLQIECFGGTNVSIVEGSSIQDASGNIYLATESGVISGSGSVTLPFAAKVAGPTAIPDEVSIYQSIPGWDSASVVSGVVGQNTESRSQFEARRRQSVAKNSVGMLNSILGAVLDVPGVLDAYVTENDLSTPQTIGGYQLAANSVYVAVVGGAAADVARAMWSKKAPGCAWNGNTTFVVPDDSAGYSPPVPLYTVKWETPAGLPIVFQVSIRSGPQVPADAVTQIQNAILAAFNGTDGSERARIGDTLYASRYVTPVVLLGSWVQLVSLQIGSSNEPSAAFTASIAGTTLTVTLMGSGALAVGQTIFDAADTLVSPTTILSQLTGTPGGIGTYELSQSQTVTSRSMTGVAGDQDLTQVNIDQSPTLSADNIVVTVV